MPREETAKPRLIECARQEFLQCGYGKASLRRICAHAGVTTGALYFFFRSKEELFEAVVGDAARQLMHLLMRQTTSEVGGEGDSAACQRELIRYIFSHRDEVRILLRGAEGTAYADYYQRYCDQVASGFCQYYDKCGGPAEHRGVMRVLAAMRVQGYIDLLEREEDSEMLMRYAALLECYGDHGFAGMMKDFDRMICSSAE